MNKKLNPGSLVAFCLIAVVSGLVGFACGGAADSCAAKSDDDIVKAIYDEIKKDPVLVAQLVHINVFVKTDPVTKKRETRIQGWTDKADDWDKVKEIVTKTECVTDPDFSAFYKAKGDAGPEVPTAPGFCTAGYVPCRDMCVPTGQCRSPF